MHHPRALYSFGERFSLTKHTQGTEIKAITYSNLQIFDHGALYTAGDEIQGAAAAGIADASVATVASSEGADLSFTSMPGTGHRRAACDVFIIVDI